ncbi:MAG: hypothetical protein ACYCZV_14020 [Acidimicrobiales bacterium]
MTGPPTPEDRAGSGGLVVIGGEARPLRRSLGALAWFVLEELALRAGRDDQGWVVFGGVRGLAAGLGVNKDTAARALAGLISTGVVTRERALVPGVAPRPGYRLELPVGVGLWCPKDQDSGDCPSVGDRLRRPKSWDGPVRPSDGDSGGRPTGPDNPGVAARARSASPLGPEGPKPERPPMTARRHPEVGPPAQGALFSLVPEALPEDDR